MKKIKIYSSLFLLLSCASLSAQDKQVLKQIEKYFETAKYEQAKKLLDHPIFPTR